MLSGRHELFSPGHVGQDIARMWPVVPDLGLRLGYYPWHFVGLEAEGGVMPSGLRERDGSALLYTARGQLVARIPLWHVRPFVLVGGGALGVHSKPEVLGRDVDAALHFGGGLEVNWNKRYLATARADLRLRFDVRDIVSWRRGIEPSFAAHNLEATLGFVVTLNRRRR